MKNKLSSLRNEIILTRYIGQQNRETGRKTVKKIEDKKLF